VLAATLTLLCAPVLADLAISGASGPFTYFAADTFYYLTIARNIARHGLASFDGQHLTNGFHPLWQLLLGGLYFGAEHLGAGRYGILLVTVLASLALCAGALTLLARAFTDRGGLTPLFVLLPVGVYGLLVVPCWLLRLKTIGADSPMEGPYPVFGTLWSYANGMESGAVLCAFAACAWAHQAWIRRPSFRGGVRFGLAAGTLVLARLDHVIVILPLVLTFATNAFRRSRQMRDAFVPLACFGLPLALDIAVNLQVFGGAVPVSGALKLSFPLITSVHIQSWVDTWAHPAQFNLYVVQREASLVLPVCFAVLYLCSTLRVTALGSSAALAYRGRTREIDRFLAPVAVGVIGFGLHEILFLADGPGQWHLPVSTLFVSLACVAMASRVRWRVPRLAALGAVAGLAALTLVFFIHLRQPGFHANYAAFYYGQAPALRKAFGEHPPRFVEVDDGIVNYALDVPAMSSGLALDPEGFDARRANHLYALAYERGFNCVSSLVYASGAPPAGARSAEAAQRYAADLLREDLSAYEFNFAYVTPTADLAIVCGHKP